MERAYAMKVFTLAALLTAFSGAVFGAGKGAVKPQKGIEHSSERARANTNAQWSADPDHGWVRADERHRPQDHRQSPDKPSSGQPKAKGKSKKL